MRFRSKKYTFIWIGLIFVLIGIYSVSKSDAATKQSTFFAVVDLPPGTIISSDDIDWRDGKITESEKELVLSVNDVSRLVGMEIGPFGVRQGRPLLETDIVKPNDRLYELKLVGDITIPEQAKLVSVFLLYDERKHPGRGQKLLADSVPVKRVYNNQNIPILPSDQSSNIQRVPRAISLYVNEQQKEAILSEMKNGNFYFTTIP